MERVEKKEMYIPSIFAHGVFKNTGKDVLLTKTGIEYYYSLIYLVREELLFNNPNLLKKKKKGGYKLNNKVKWNSQLDIYMYDVLRVINPEHKSDFTALKKFIPILNNLWVEINVLEKVKGEAARTIKVVDNISIDTNTKKVSIKFNLDFIKHFVHIKKYFRKVILNYMFKLEGFKDKTLYMMMGDYCGVTKNIDRKDLYRFIGTNSIDKIDNLMSYVNYSTDIKINPTIISKGKYRDVLKLAITSQIQFLDAYDKVEYYIKKNLWLQAEQQTPIATNNGVVIKNKKSYTKKIYTTLMKDFDDMVEIDILIEDARVALAVHKNKDYKQYMIMITEDKKQYMINDNYTLIEFPNLTKATSTIKATAKILEAIKDCYLHDVDKNNNTISFKSVL